MPSGRTRSRPEAPPIFFLDRGLGRNIVAAALRDAGFIAITMIDVYPHGTDQRAGDDEFPGSNQVAGAPNRPGFRGGCSGGVRLAECLLVLLCWFRRFGSLVGSPVDGGFGSPDGSVWSPPGGVPAGCHGQFPAAFVDQVVMLLAEWEQVVD